MCPTHFDTVGDKGVESTMGYIGGLVRRSGMSTVTPPSVVGFDIRCIVREMVRYQGHDSVSNTPVRVQHTLTRPQVGDKGVDSTVGYIGGLLRRSGMSTVTPPIVVGFLRSGFTVQDFGCRVQGLGCSGQVTRRTFGGFRV